MTIDENIKKAAITREPVFVFCGDCLHEWPAFYLPLTLDDTGIGLLESIGKSLCPMCASKRVFIGGKTPTPTTESEAKDG